MGELHANDSYLRCFRCINSGIESKRGCVLLELPYDEAQPDAPTSAARRSALRHGSRASNLFSRCRIQVGLHAARNSVMAASATNLGLHFPGIIRLLEMVGTSATINLSRWCRTNCWSMSSGYFSGMLGPERSEIVSCQSQIVGNERGALIGRLSVAFS